MGKKKYEGGTRRGSWFLKCDFDCLNKLRSQVKREQLTKLCANDEAQPPLPCPGTHEGVSAESQTERLRGLGRNGNGWGVSVLSFMGDFRGLEAGVSRRDSVWSLSPPPMSRARGRSHLLPTGS